MNILIPFKTIGILVVTLSSSLYAGGDHKHGEGGHSHGPGGHSHAAPTVIDEKKAKIVAVDVVKKLVAKKKLKQDWLKIEVKATSKKKFKEKMEWVITLENTKAEKSKQILYVFLSLTGKYLGANFTGN
ncbi:hypothetical protein MNBD_GAMMA12-250 [hydrothermal vent metagenome]|uniref:Uncharacterized protein n=1 Tax=hydrothermal vent metagenome TaxID=652676 RepID=A0A3B0Y8I4_9ZZZZ